MQRERKKRNKRNTQKEKSQKRRTLPADAEAMTNTLKKYALSVLVFILNIPRSAVIKAGMLVVLIVFLISVYSMQDADDVSLKKIDRDLCKKTDIEEMEKCNPRQLMQFTGLDAAAFDSFLYYKSGEALSAEELIIIKADSPDDLDTAQDAVESRISSQITTYKDYAPDQAAMLNNAIVSRRGDYLFYCTAEKPEKYEEVFDNAV